MKKLFSGRAVFMALVLSFLFAVSLPGPAQAVSVSGTVVRPYEYTVTIPGDSLSQIAERMCGHVRYWKLIAQANKIIVAPYWVELNQTIMVPCAKPAAASIPVPVVSQKHAEPTPQPIAPTRIPVVHQTPSAKPSPFRISHASLRHFLHKAEAMALIAFIGIFVFGGIIAISMRLFGSSKTAKPDPIETIPTSMIEGQKTSDPIVTAELIEPARIEMNIAEEAHISPVESKMSEPIALIPRLINPTLEAVRDVARSGIPGVIFLWNDLLCLAVFESGQPIGSQFPQVFTIDTAKGIPDFIHPCDWKHFPDRVTTILDRRLQPAWHDKSLRQQVG